MEHGPRTFFGRVYRNFLKLLAVTDLTLFWLDHVLKLLTQSALYPLCPLSPLCPMCPLSPVSPFSPLSPMSSLSPLSPEGHLHFLFSLSTTTKLQILNSKSQICFGSPGFWKPRELNYPNMRELQKKTINNFNRKRWKKKYIPHIWELREVCKCW